MSDDIESDGSTRESKSTFSRNKEQKAEADQKSRIVIDWMQEVLNEKLPGKTLHENLSDGVALCKLANTLKPGCVRKFHRKPKLLMMKIENIAFFLGVCKTRFNVPEASLFTPQDLQDEKPDHANLLRVLTVLMFLVNSSDHKIEIPPITGNLHPKDNGKDPGDDNDEPNPDDLVSPRDPSKTTNTQPPKTTKSTPTLTPTAGSWYIKGNLTESSSTQADIRREILECIHKELSIDSKIKLLESVVLDNDAIEQKILYASDQELRQLCFEMGLGNVLSDVPTGKERKWYMDWIMKYGRSNNKK